MEETDIGKIIKIAGKIILIGGIILSIILGFALAKETIVALESFLKEPKVEKSYNWTLALSGIIGSVLSGLLFIWLGEIVETLQSCYSRLCSIDNALTEKDGKISIYLESANAQIGNVVDILSTQNENSKP